MMRFCSNSGSNGLAKDLAFAENTNYINSVRPRGGVVTQRSAKPCTPVQFRPWPPEFLILRALSQPRISIASGNSRFAIQGPFVIGGCGDGFLLAPPQCPRTQSGRLIVCRS